MVHKIDYEMLLKRFNDYDINMMQKDSQCITEHVIVDILKTMGIIMSYDDDNVREIITIMNALDHDHIPRFFEKVSKHFY